MTGIIIERVKHYYLDQIKKATCNSIQTKKLSLQYQRLEHPSKKIFMLFPFK